MSDAEGFPATGMVAARLEHLERVQEYGIRRAEIVQFRCTEGELRHVLAERWPEFSAHAPLIFPEWFPEWPLAASLVDLNVDRREHGLRLMEHSIDLAADLGAKYVVLHLQRTVRLLDEHLPPEADTDAALDLAIGGAERLARRAARYGLPVHLENMIANPLFCLPEHYEALLDAVPEVGLCLDVGHFWIDGAKFGFDPLQSAAHLARRIWSLHVYANQVGSDFEFNEMRERGLLRKFPLHPDQRPADGWMDVPALLRSVLSVHPMCYVTHEVYRSLDTDPGRTAEGLAWIEEVCREARGAPARARAGGGPPHTRADDAAASE